MRVAAAHHAGNVGADLDVIAPGGLAAKHRIVSQRFGDLQDIEVEALGDFLEDLVAERAELILRVEHHGNQRGSLDRVAPGEVVKFFFQCRRKLHDSA